MRIAEVCKGPYVITPSLQVLHEPEPLKVYFPSATVQCGIRALQEQQGYKSETQPRQRKPYRSFQ